MVATDELRIDLQIVVRSTSNSRLPAEDVHDLRFAIGANQQPGCTIRGGLTDTRRSIAVQPVDALLNVADERCACRSLLLETLDEHVTVGNCMTGLLDGGTPVAVDLLQLLNAGALVACLAFEPADGFFGRAQLVLEFSDARRAVALEHLDAG